MQSIPSKNSKKTREEASTDATLRRFVGYRLKRAYSTLRADLLYRLEPLGLRTTTFSTLLLIVDNPGLRQSALASALDIKRSNMVAIIDDLEQKGWITRKQVPMDRRAFALYATGAGKHTSKKAVALVTKHESDLLGCLNDEELNNLFTILTKIESSAETD